jgi:hypothetical protein
VPIDWDKIKEIMQAREEGTYKMPIDPKYAAVIEKNKKKNSGGGDYEKLPAIWLNNVGDGFRGTVTRVSDIMEIDDKYNEGQKKDVQFVDLKDVTLRRLDADKGEFVETPMEAGTFMLSKGGHFEAVYQALVDLNSEAEGDGFSDIPVSGMFAMRRLANDDKRHVFSAKVTSGVPF